MSKQPKSGQQKPSVIKLAKLSALVAASLSATVMFHLAKQGGCRWRISKVVASANFSTHPAMVPKWVGKNPIMWHNGQFVFCF